MSKMMACAAAAICLAASSLPALASCKDDIAVLQARLTAGPRQAPNVVNANKELVNAQKAVTGSEVECDNAVARAWRAYHAPVPKQGVAAKGKGPNGAGLARPNN